MLVKASSLITLTGAFGFGFGYGYGYGYGALLSSSSSSCSSLAFMTPPTRRVVTHPVRRLPSSSQLGAVVSSPVMGRDNDDDESKEASESSETKESKMALSRRRAIFRFSSAVVASNVAVAGGTFFSNAADAVSAEFSDSPTSQTSVAREETYGNNNDEPVDPTDSPVISVVSDAFSNEPSVPTTTVAAALSTEDMSSVASDDAVTPTAASAGAAADESSVKLSTLEVKSTLPDFSNLSELSQSNKLALGGVAGLAAFIYVANQVFNGEEDSASSSSGGGTAAAAPPPPSPAAAAAAALPYGLREGRNFSESGKQIVKPPPPPAAAAAPLAPPAAATSAPPKKEEDPTKPKPKWKMDTPTPYGIQNKNRNPFIKKVEELCEPAKINKECTDSIKDYLDYVGSSAAGALAAGGGGAGIAKVSKEDAATIIGYLDSLSGGGGGAGATDGSVGKSGAFASYLDALSVGAAPAPVSAKAVKSYLDTLTSTGGGGATKVAPKRAPPKVSTTVSTMISSNKAPTAAATTTSKTSATTSRPDYSSSAFATFDTRITKVEQRVTRLEDKVERIPDQVFQRMEEWKAKQDKTLSAEVAKIVEALTGGSVGSGSGAAPSAPSATRVSSGAGPAKKAGFGSYLDSLNP